MGFTLAKDAAEINQSLFQITHGLYVLTARNSEKCNGYCRRQRPSTNAGSFPSSPGTLGPTRFLWVCPECGVGKDQFEKLIS